MRLSSCPLGETSYLENHGHHGSTTSSYLKERFQLVLYIFSFVLFGHTYHSSHKFFILNEGTRRHIHNSPRSSFLPYRSSHFCPVVNFLCWLFSLFISGVPVGLFASTYTVWPFSPWVRAPAPSFLSCILCFLPHFYLSRPLFALARWSMGRSLIIPVMPHVHTQQYIVRTTFAN